MKKINADLKELYSVYIHKHLCPESALEIASNFILDLINVFGEKLDATTPLKPDWKPFAPFEFLLELNSILARYKEKGPDGLDDLEHSLLRDNSLLIGSLTRAALIAHPDAYSEEDHFQIPQAVADNLEFLVEKG